MWAPSKQLQRRAPAEIVLSSRALDRSAQRRASQGSRRAVRLLATEHRPADRVAQPLVIEHKFANSQRQPLTLPAALAPTSTIALTLRASSPRCFDRIGGGPEFVGCNMGHRRRSEER